MKKLLIYALFTQLTIFLTSYTFDNEDPLLESKLTYCSEIVEEVDNMQLVCDTLFLDSLGSAENSYDFKGIYLDAEKRLRKYWRNEIHSDGAAESIDMTAYYDPNGDLVYIEIGSSYDCGSDYENICVHKGSIVKYYHGASCHCCEEAEDQESEEELPLVGEPLKETMGWGLSLERFIHADTLFQCLKAKEYSNNSEFYSR